MFFFLTLTGTGSRKKSPYETFPRGFEFRYTTKVRSFLFSTSSLPLSIERNDETRFFWGEKNVGGNCRKVKAMDQAIKKGKRIGFPWHSKQYAHMWAVECQSRGTQRKDCSNCYQLQLLLTGILRHFQTLSPEKDTFPKIRKLSMKKVEGGKSVESLGSRAQTVSLQRLGGDATQSPTQSYGQPAARPPASTTRTQQAPLCGHKGAGLGDKETR